MAEINTSPGSKRKIYFRKSVHHHSTKVDLTPMVDLGFLLITFFVFTTSMSQPTAMNLLEAKDGGVRNVKQSGAMTIIVAKDHQLFYYYGILEPGRAASKVRKIDFKDARLLIAEKKKQTQLGDLMYIIKSDDNASFGDNIGLLDEMAICNVPAGHYAEIDITKTELDIIRSATNL
ncbi:MAG: biopolymer transporter ExbD [Ferruginibacter sp.]|nr:biopolymer transporter ExbD [Ferruginibacter sp.]